MMRRFAIAMTVCVAPATSLDAQSDFWSFLREGRVLHRCVDGSEPSITAQAAWRRLESAIGALGDTSDAEPVVASIRDLLRHPCLHLAVENGPLQLPTHPTAVRAWWEDGGQYWLWSYIRPGKAGRMDDLRETVTLPPDPRRVLFPETSTDPGLAPLLCPQSELACGAETGGWVQRASEALAAPRKRPPSWHDEPEKPAGWLSCDGQGPDAYAQWRACIGNVDEPVKALPLGRTRAPREGWLIVIGRRGHYEFCDGVSAYDLATGAAYRVESCSGLALRGDGSVDVDATDEIRKSRIRSGRVLLDNLREALWMLVMDTQTEVLHTRARNYPLPRGLEARLRFQGVPEAPAYPHSWMGNSGQTLLRWAWARNDGSIQAEGDLVWGSYDLSEAHAGELLEIAERSLIEGCAPAPLPAALPRKSAAVNSLDASASSVQRTFEDLWAVLAVYRPLDCSTP